MARTPVERIYTGDAMGGANFSTAASWKNTGGAIYTGREGSKHLL